ncbi:MAG: hypothetical protein RDU20_03215 [Desulfomonilaceae bacterium]|nr:hypothetical protein [Desulfomonilaceae bacterium]
MSLRIRQCHWLEPVEWIDGTKIACTVLGHIRGSATPCIDPIMELAMDW